MTEAFTATSAEPVTEEKSSLASQLSRHLAPDFRPASPAPDDKLQPSLFPPLAASRAAARPTSASRRSARRVIPSGRLLLSFSRLGGPQSRPHFIPAPAPPAAADAASTSRALRHGVTAWRRRRAFVKCRADSHYAPIRSAANTPRLSPTTGGYLLTLRKKTTRGGRRHRSVVARQARPSITYYFERCRMA